MERDFLRDWMWSEAFAMLARTERLLGEVIRPGGSLSRLPVWEPPVDILETARAVLILVALPGVNLDQVEATISGAELVISGTRVLPNELRTAVIHRLELPQGRFERRLRLPAGEYRQARRSVSNGCLVITLDKVEASRG
ncbi:MAG: Hsp20/alpha crystallin family protein [Hyphomicrobiaceae bacterium]